VWEVATGKELRRFTWDRPDPNNPLKQALLLTVAFSPDGKVLAAGGDFFDADGGLQPQVRLWEMTSGKERRRLLLRGDTDLRRIGPRPIVGGFAVAAGGAFREAARSGRAGPRSQTRLLPCSSLPTASSWPW
jgi:hypothetical protein